MLVVALTLPFHRVILYCTLLPSKEQWKSVITKDQWALVLDFTAQILSDLSNYSEEGEFGSRSIDAFVGITIWDVFDYLIVGH